MKTLKSLKSLKESKAWMKQDVKRALFMSVHGRYMNQDVAHLVHELLTYHDETSNSLMQELTALAQYSSFNYDGYRSSMNQDYHKTVQPVRQVQRAKELFREPFQAGYSEEELGHMLTLLSGNINKIREGNNFKQDRLNREQRREAGLGQISKRRYNKLFRFLTRFEDKIKTYSQEIVKERLTRVGKSLLAIDLTEDLLMDDNTLCFVAYMTSTLNRRSIFTNQEQVRAFDRIADQLWKRCTRSETTNYFAVAHVFLDEKVAKRLSDEQKGTLIGRYYQIMSDAAIMLRKVWNSFGEVNLTEMIVRRGQDSSTWNQSAGAWNKAREIWMGLLETLNMTSMFEDRMPGKIMRLMAADVARWHQSSGGGVHPDTKVWADLPYPWLVITGEQECDIDLIRKACERHEVDPSKGWVNARMKKEAVAVEHSPELVHGVVVGSPFLAKILRDAGAFSGKKFDWKKALEKNDIVL